MNDENLKPAKPGEVRNPSGRPKGTKNRATIARKVLSLLAKDAINPNSLAILRQLVGDRIDEMTVEEAMSIVQANDAISGKRRATSYKVIMDSAYGAPKQSMEISGEDGGPILVDDVSKKTDDELRERIAILRAGLASTATGEK